MYYLDILLFADALSCNKSGRSFRMKLINVCENSLTSGGMKAFKISSVKVATLSACVVICVTLGDQCVSIFYHSQEQRCGVSTQQYIPVTLSNNEATTCGIYQVVN